MNAIVAMQIYVRVAQLLSFSQAAQSLGLPKSKVSVAVRQLEAQLGARLLHRTTRRVSMTPDGLVFYERCLVVLADAEDLFGLFRHADSAAPLHGLLRVDLPTAVVRDVVLPKLGEFLAAHPQLRIDLSSSDRRVDLVGEGFDCVLRVGPLADSSYVVRPLGYYRMVNCASPSYAAQHGLPQQLDELAGHSLIHYASASGMRDEGFEYVDPGAAGHSRHIAMPGVLTVNQSDAYYAACLAGLGIIQAPEVSVRAALDSGKLLELLPQFRARPMPVSLLYPHRRHVAPRVRAFMIWLENLLRPRLIPDLHAPG